MLLTDSNKAVLEAFFLGRAFAEVINDRLGAALGDFLSEIAKADAERRQAWKYVFSYLYRHDVS